uniref:DNA repair and recombination protein RAD54B n=1 Tax=Kwoniella bestiolae CBS 10118 TaxID=1296100 RepID=A0A1B9GAL4_9TREE|nr:hypothetical protein I302_02896 [Kwoniella bestiolae CBS 10118]OCF28045.1 hypothetical protein I302_02896 [Kwoniella bestiolae CBS 10118]
MTYSPSSSKPKRGLGAIIDSIATQADRIPDSCSEGSGSDSDSDDEEEVGVGSISTPQPIPLTPHTGPSRSSSKGKERAVDSPRVEMSLGRSGRNVYQVVTPGRYAEYFAVQCSLPWPPQHKTWDGDAFIKVEGNKITMIDEEGNYKGVTGKGERDVCADQELRIGGMDILVDREVSKQEFKAGTTILNKPKPSSILGPTAYRATTFAKPFKAPTQTHAPKPVAGYIPGRTSSGGLTAAPPGIPLSHKVEMPISKPIAAKSFYGPSVVRPKASRIVLGEKSSKERMEWGGALFNPNAEGAVVMPRPPEKLVKIMRQKHPDLDVVDVVVDPILGSLLRKHQKEGVKFLYSCVMGYTAAEAEGCILADDMGLGKTLQSIALIHTLLCRPQLTLSFMISIQKVLIVCPVTLVENWRKEFKKWTSAKTDKRINVLVADGTNYRISSFVNNKNMQVLIIGYERLAYSKELASCQPPIGLIVCDEGQRLKSKDNKTKKMFDALSCQRRIILSGTPIQNDLAEYWAMVDFTCPGMLGRYNAFNKQYEKPIMAGRAVGANSKVVELGEERASELHKLSKEFVLRRTADVMENFLPPKHEYVLFVAPSLLQLSVLARLLQPSIVGGLFRGGQQSLALIDMMRKISNSPMLLRKKDDEGISSEEIGSALSEAKSAIPLDVNVNDTTTSGKMLVLDKMLHSIHQETTEKVVVVSNWTATLNLIQDMCKIRKYPYLRLDGSTPAKQRQELVDTFNRDVRREESFVFLLSAKAGGVGLNLIGGSRLFLFDSDWNPSTDLQAMARIHRDGQKRPVYIYRLLTTNAIDEKIYQRQITKMGLADQMMEQGEVVKESKDSFSHAELRDIFTLNLKTDGCQTHDLLGCDCSTNTAQIAETTSEETSTVAEDEEGDDEEEEKAKFVNANDYNPNLPVKMLKKAAAEQQQKLKALKKWAHFDSFDHHSFRNVMDPTLYKMLYEAWDSDEGALVASATASEEAEDKKNRKKKRKVAGSDDGEGEDTPDKVLDSAEEDEDEDSEGSTVVVPSKRKKGSSKSRSRKESSEEYEDLLGMGKKKKHDLRKIAENGGTGRVMFVFEKISKSKLR